MTACPVCRCTAVEPVLTVRAAPLQIGVAWPDRAAARSAEVGDTVLTVCTGCGFLFNAGFEPGRVRYTVGYDVVLVHSGVYRDYLEAEARLLVERYGVRGRRVVEIGCGDGYFLRLLARLGGNEGLGFDPSLPCDVVEPGLRLSAAEFTPSPIGGDAGLVVIRSVLELVPDPVGFLRDARAVLRPGGLCYLEVPNVEWVLRDGMAWNIHYEHCSYFTAGTLGTVCAGAGLRVLETAPVYHDGQYLRAVAVLDEAEPAVVGTARRFGDFYRAAVASWTARLRAAGDAGRTVILWGAGGRGASFLAAVDPAAELVAFAVDVNPARHGAYLPVTGHVIRPPDALAAADVDVIIVANDTYLTEVTRMARARGFEGELWTP
nr:hypothetical protein GCM10020063_010330 [Dactylosporangium thailandense]